MTQSKSIKRLPLEMYLDLLIIFMKELNIFHSELISDYIYDDEWSKIQIDILEQILSE